MLRTLSIVPLIAIALLSAAAGEAGKPGYEVIDWKDAPKGVTGSSTGDLKHPVKKSSIIHYRIYAPATLPEKPLLGLIICFHGLGGNEEGMTGHAHQAFTEIKAADGYVIAGGKSQGNGWAPSDEPSLLQFIDWLETVYPIDRRRVFIWGHSNGGWMSSWFGSRHPDRFAGLVRWAGYAQDMPGKAGEDLEYYLVHGEADPTVKVDGSRALRDQLQQRGFRYVYREIKDGDHGNILGMPAVRQDPARWIDALRHKEIPLPAEDLRWLKLVASAKGEEMLANADTWKEIVRIGGAPAWQAIAKTAKSKSAPIRLALAQACGRCRFADEETVAALDKLADDEDAGVRTAATTALGMHANWRSQPAQIALVRLTLAKKRALEDRLAATGGLTAALGLPLLGNCADDPALFKGTVELLDAEPAEIRSATIVPLKVAVKDGLGYDPLATIAVRKPAVAAWETWFEDRSGHKKK